MLDGEIAYRKGDMPRAIAALTDALQIEKQVAYMEPPEWPLPVRHALGAVLLEAGRVAEAAQVDERFRKAWAQADVTIGASCLCVAGAKAAKN